MEQPKPKDRRTLPKRWFAAVRNDPSKLDEACDWYLSRLQEAHDDLAIEGNLAHLNQTHPGIQNYYDAMHTDLDMLEEMMDRELRQTKGRRMKQWSDNPPTNSKTTATELKLMLEADDEVIEASMRLENVRYVYKQFGSLMKAYADRGFALSNITRLRIANMEEVEV